MKQPLTATSHSSAYHRDFAHEAAGYIFHLTIETKELKADNEFLKDELDSYKEQNAAVLQETERLQEQNRLLEEENQRLCEEIAQRQAEDEEGVVCIAKHKGAIITLIKVIYALCNLSKPLFVTRSGSPATQKQVMAFFGKVLHVDLKNASQRLSATLEESDNLSNHVGVFKEMMEIITDRFNRR